MGEDLECMGRGASAVMSCRRFTWLLGKAPGGPTKHLERLFCLPHRKAAGNNKARSPGALEG